MATKTAKFEATFGSDPELMLYDREQGRVVSSIPVLKRDKYDPIVQPDGSKVYFDNTMVEFAMPPSNSKKEILAKFTSMFTHAKKVLGDKYGLVAQSSHVFDDDQLTDPRALEAGCDPNYNAHESKQNEAPQFKGGLRSGSFHIHVGAKNLRNFTAREDAIKILDVFLGASSIIFDKDETAPARRALYGKSGEFRPTEYGIEYRVLGNFALRSPETTELVFDLVEHTLKEINNGNAAKILKTIDLNKVRKAIDTNDKALAKEILTEAKLPEALMKRVEKDYVLTADFINNWVK